MVAAKSHQEPTPQAADAVEEEAPVINQAAIDLLTSWLEDDDEESIAEQRETLE